MSRRGQRTLAVLAVAGTGFLGASVVVGARELLRRQAAAARRVIGKPLGEQAPAADRIWKRSYGDPVALLVLGDSIAAGLGAERRKDTLGARLAKGVARTLHRAVDLRVAAVVGSESSALPLQLDGLPRLYRADVAVIVVGGNDVTHRVPVADSVAFLVAAIERLRADGTEVVVGTCPDLGALRPVPQPLRSLGSRASRQLAAAQAAAAREAGAYVVSLADVVGPFFVTNPDEMFSLDRFHPSALGYRRTAEAMLPSVLAALGHRQEMPFGHHRPAVEAPEAPEGPEA
ncbi:SGNH/GDSL hydrolase family protein [Nocardioides sp. TRM66260-LWL]|uniref:SGNH/GDSL hydrolase family protein n=1 Tax=Nocardioides sp. TRM66260-LWL TaxID=2874478 RepID=UPI001CC6162B|nr:SGNH/GDSL hydrolase family protein [Nocardioides sp. TRM66260-LWL]MBZ5734589.1 SGNH/GDSL hydrolase family protein [Nocardioides sp. TRM66260-LWL]